MAEAPRGIQATLFDYFQDTEYFTIQEANELVLDYQNRNVNAESIRARIYEGIDKGLFERVGKGLYTVTRKDEQGRENTCLLINGDGRDLSMIPDNSIDALITDHPYDLKGSLKGGNRDFASYELFQYTEQDMAEKFRVLKPGSFLCEFLPEETGDNFEYLYHVKNLARKAGFEYFAKVPWRKGDNFVANTGRKSKNTEDICFFSKGRARDLRPNAKKDKQYANSRSIVEYKEYIPGSTTVHAPEMGGLGTSSETKVEPIDVNIRISVSKRDAEQAKGLLESAWDNAVIYAFENSPLDIDNGGEYTYEQLDEMSTQEYMLRYLSAKGLSYVDLSPGPENIFTAATEVIVNPTNLIGPMGAGLAKEFRDQFPGIEDIYKESCHQRKSAGTKGYLAPNGITGILTSKSEAMYEGCLFLVGQNPAILCFPTKRDWKDPSDLDLIEAGLKTFVQNYKKYNIKSIAFPKLGCGLGGLNWDKEVKPLMQKYLGNLPDINIQVCGDTLREDKVRHYMSGAAGMLPTVFDVDPPNKKDKIHQAEKPVELLKQILAFVTLEGETALDQFAGSGALGVAALESGRNSILIEKDEETFAKLRQRIEALGNIDPQTPAQQEALHVAVDALEAAYDGPDAMTTFADYQNQNGMPLAQAYSELNPLLHTPVSPEQEEQQEALHTAAEAIQTSDCIGDKFEGPPEKYTTTPIPETPNVLECSSLGDKRFSSIYAKLTIGGKEQSIEEFYQNAKRTSDGKKAGRGKPFEYLVDPFTGDKLPASDAPDLYRGLWVTYFNRNPALVEEAAQYDEFHNKFTAKGLVTEPRHEEIIAAYVKGDRERYVEVLRCSHWYQNMAAKKKNPTLNDRLRDIAERQAANSTRTQQISLFGKQDFDRSG